MCTLFRLVTHIEEVVSCCHTNPVKSKRVGDDIKKESHLNDFLLISKYQAKKEKLLKPLFWLHHRLHKPSIVENLLTQPPFSLILQGFSKMAEEL